MLEMLHIAPQRRPNAAQIANHPWIRQPCGVVMPQTVNVPISQMDNQVVPSDESVHLRETVAATYRAIANSPQVAHHLGPVAMSELARRRLRDKKLIRL